MNMLMRIVTDALGIDVEQGTLAAAGQSALRTVVIYALALTLVRIGEKRFLGKSTAFDVVLGVMLGSLMSRAITSPQQFVPIVVAGGVFVALHWLMAAITFRSDYWGSVLKGRERLLIDEGEVLWDAMQKSHISEKDLLSALRRNGRVTDPCNVEKAYLERDGDISVIRKASS
jgi:uncharacterized membrane protein YcaP (DUF421 family)